MYSSLQKRFILATVNKSRTEYTNLTVINAVFIGPIYWPWCPYVLQKQTHCYETNCTTDTPIHAVIFVPSVSLNIYCNDKCLLWNCKCRHMFLCCTGICVVRLRCMREFEWRVTQSASYDGSILKEVSTHEFQISKSVGYCRGKICWQAHTQFKYSVQIGRANKLYIRTSLTRNWIKGRCSWNLKVIEKI